MRKTKYPSENKTLGQKIRKRRMDLGKSLEEIADEADTTGSYLSRIESDKKIPTPKITAKIAKALKINPVELHELLIADTITNTLNNSALTEAEIAKFVKSKKLSDFLKSKK